MNDADDEYPKTFIKPNITSQMWDDFYSVIRMIEKSLDTNMWNKKDLYIVSLNMDGILRKRYSLMESRDE